MLTQQDMFGNHHRVQSVESIMADLWQQWKDIPGLSLEDKNKGVVAEYLVNFLSTLGFFDDIQAANQDETRALLKALATRDDFPSFETAVRTLRKVRSTNPADHTSYSSQPLATYQQILGDIDNRIGNARSSLESKVKVFLQTALPSCNFVRNDMAKGYSHTWEVDFISRSLGLILEIDSWEFHKSKSSFQKDRFKTRDLQKAGYKVLSYSGEDLSVKGGFTRLKEDVFLMGGKNLGVKISP